MVSGTTSPDSDIPGCAVCHSPSVTSFHFGSRTCKACAAFFRRTVALNVQYSCKGKGDCTVNYEKRMICKKCRFERCISVEMNPDLVRSKGMDQKHSVSECSDSPSTSVSIQEPTSSTKDWDTDRTIHRYTKLESNLNDRRRILYGNAEMTEIFMGLCECPYDRSSLRECDFLQHDHRPGVVAIMDFVRGFPHFDDLSGEDQNMLYRYCIGVDHILDSAWYSIKIGLHESLSLCPDGYYIRMDPLPPTNFENYPDKDKLKTDEQRNIYQCFIPLQIKHWFSIVKPMHYLQMTFQEFSLLKALACWHTSYHRLSDDGKPLAELEKNKLIHALLQLSTGPGRLGPERLGELLLFMTPVFDEMHTMLSTLILITTFPIFQMDPLLSDVLDYKKW